MGTMVLWIKVILALIPLAHTLIQMIRENRIKQEMVKEIGDALQLEARRLVDNANLARDAVDHSASGVQNDPYNRD